MAVRSPIISLPANGWEDRLHKSLDAPATDSIRVRAEVSRILNEVRTKGDPAVRKLSVKFDKFSPPKGKWEVPAGQFGKAKDSVPPGRARRDWLRGPLTGPSASPSSASKAKGPATILVQRGHFYWARKGTF